MSIRGDDVRAGPPPAAVAPGIVPGLRVSWGGIWAGVLTVLGVLLLLAALGLAIGITTAGLGPEENLDARALGTGAAIWSAITLLIALFAGGLVAARLGMVIDRTAANMQGAMVWVLSMLGVIWLASSGVALVAGGAFNLAGGALQTVASTAGAADLGNLATGSPEQMAARLRDPQTASTIAAATGMAEQQVRQQLTEVAQRVEAARDNPEKAAAEMRQGMQAFAAQAGQRLDRAAGQAQPRASATAWITFAALVLSLLAAIGGAIVGGRQAAARIGLAEGSTAASRDRR